MAGEPQGNNNFGRRLGEIFLMIGSLNQEFRRFLKSLPALLINNIITGNANREDYEDFLARAEESTLAGTAIINDVVKPAIERAQDLGQEAIDISQEAFDPDAVAERFGEVFDPITGDLETLSGDVVTGNEAVQALLAETSGEFEEGAADILGGFEDLRGELRGGAADITGGFDEILGRARGLVSELGEAERQDINRRFTEAGSEAEASLRERGFGGTLAAGARIGAERERSTALLGLEEQLASQQLGVEQTFGLAGLSAQERLFGAGINLGAQELGAQERLVGVGANLGATQAGALQFGNQLFATTALDALSQQAAIGFGKTGGFDQATLARINTLLGAGAFDIEAALGGADLATQFFPNLIVAPTATQTPNPASFVN